MPYTETARRQLVRAKKQLATEDGDWNLLYTIEYLEAFIEKPCYATIARIGKASRNPRRLVGVDALEAFLTVNGVSLEDRTEARDEALAEFRRRIVAKYEDECIKKNGDLDEYKRAEKAIQDKFAPVEAK